ncbi:hypothetical protein ANN_15570 [Periplaneta americana]|uniref:Gustatory receptor n=1 Tax=Periplaneta americana TaxID=6978 RepID=A0ABQ8SHY6_PERAM|nr:hypothetical protein ANN_15570 [Periplaneta americana]
MSTKWILYSIAVLLFVTTSSTLSVVQRVIQPELLATVIVNEFLMMSVGAIKAFTSILMSITLNGIRSRKIVSKIIKVDRGLLIDPINTYRSTFIFTLVQVVAVYSYILILFTYDTWVWTNAMDNMSAMYLISGYPHRIINIATVLQFCDLVLLLRSRLKALNARLSFVLRNFEESGTGIILSNNASSKKPEIPTVVGSKIFRASEIKSGKIVPFVQSPRIFNRLQTPSLKISERSTIHSLRELYDDLCDINVLINSTFGLQLLLELGVTTIELTSSLYLTLATLLRIQTVAINFIGQFTSLMLAWLLEYSFKLVSVTAPCQSAGNEVETTAVLVQKLLLVRRFDDETMAELQLFSQQLLQRKMKFTAFGFLNLDYSLLFTIIGGVTTYLVIAMQYKK